MLNILVRKLSNYDLLEPEDIARLNELVHISHVLPPATDIIRQGDEPHSVHLVLQGVACRYKILPSGGRPIVALMIPGDFCDLRVAILTRMDHDIGTLTECRIVDIPRSQIEDLLNNYPRIARALWWATLVDEAILREWLVNMGQRRADRMIGHLICELLLRCNAVGINQPFSLPLTQEQLGDALGLSAVHTQRVLTTLRDQGLLALKDRAIIVPDFARLSEFSGFNSDYLHLPKRPVYSAG